MRDVRLLAAVVIGLALAGCGSSPASPQATAQGSPSTHISGPVVVVTLRDFQIVPASLTVPAGTSNFEVTNVGATPHNFTIRDAAGKTVAATRTLDQNQSQVLTVELTAPTYGFLCSQPGHASLGMTGMITVTGAAS